MRKYVFLMAALFVMLAGFWAVKDEVTVTDRLEAPAPAADSAGRDAHRMLPPRESAPREAARQERGVLPAPPPVSQALPPVQESGQAPREAGAYNMDDPLEREQLAASLRKQGFPEKEIRNILRPGAGEIFSGKEELSESESSPLGDREARAYNMDDPLEREQLAASLREQGFPEREIQEILKRGTGDPLPGGDDSLEPALSAVGDREAQAYNMDDPLEREQLAASLREQGMPEKEIRNILRDAPVDDPPQDALPSHH
jgi:DNA-binding transcriptional MerR regulator